MWESSPWPTNYHIQRIGGMLVEAHPIWMWPSSTKSKHGDQFIYAKHLVMSIPNMLYTKMPWKPGLLLGWSRLSWRGVCDNCFWAPQKCGSTNRYAHWGSYLPQNDQLSIFCGVNLEFFVGLASGPISLHVHKTSLTARLTTILINKVTTTHVDSLHDLIHMAQPISI